MPNSAAKNDVSNTSFGGSIAGSIGGIQPSQSVAEDSSYLTIAKQVLVGGTPLGIAALAQYFISTILIAMVGKMVGVEELGGTSLAFGLVNATIYSFAAGFSGALETVLAHSYGRDPTSKLYGVYAQRMALLLLFVSALLGPILVFADLGLKAMGQNPEVVYYTGVFCRIAVFASYPLNMLEILRRYFACQHMSTPLSVNLLVSAAIFPFLLWALIKVFGYVGAPLGWLLLMIGMPASLLVYLIKTKTYKKTWGGFDSAALNNWGPLLKLALPSMAMMLSEWASLEVNAVTAGFAAPEHLAAYGVMYSCSGMFWSLTSGIFIEAAVLVGNALGQGKPQVARRCAYACVAMSFLQSIVNLIVLYLLRYPIARSFTNDDAVTDMFVALIPIFSVYHVFDCIQSCMMGVLRGCGKQVAGSIAIALVYSVVGVPLGVILFFTTDLSVRALWIGPAVGVSCVGAPVYFYMLFRFIKWDEIELGDEDVPSLNSSMDRRSMLSRAPSSPCSSDVDSDADGENMSGHTAEMSPHRSSMPTSGMQTPGSALLEPGGGPGDNTSFASHFHIPGRNILITPSVTQPSPTPKQHVLRGRKSGTPSLGASPVLESHNDGFLLPPVSRKGPAASDDEESGGGGGSSDSEASLRRPPSSNTTASSRAGSSTRLARRDGARSSRSQSRSSLDSLEAPPGARRTPRPSSRRSTPTGEYET